MVKHVQIRIDAADHKQLRILCAKRGCSLQELLKNDTMQTAEVE